MRAIPCHDRVSVGPAARAALFLGLGLAACSSGEEPAAPEDGESAWHRELEAADGLLYGAMKGIRVRDVVTYPNPKTYSSFVGSLFEATALTAGEVLASLPSDHAFWQRSPARLGRRSVV